MHVDVEIVAGPMAGTIYRLERPGTYIFGRGDDVQCSLRDDPTISRRHFAILADPPRARVRDLGGANGLAVNDQPLAADHDETPERELRHGDLIQVGQSALRIVAPGQYAPPPPNPEALPPRPPSSRRNYDADTGLFFSNNIIDNPAIAAGRDTGFPVPKGMAGMDGFENTGLFFSGRAAEARELAIDGYDGAVLIGRGGAGEVFRARERATGRLVAIKRLRAGTLERERAWERFLREIRLAGQLRHPHLVDFVTAGQTADGRRYLVMEYMAGGDLAQRLDKLPDGKGMEPADAVTVMRQVLDGVAAVHAEGIVHRDLKPANILFVGDELTPAKVADLGLAKDLEKSAAITRDDMGGGTPEFMAPEQFSDLRYTTPAADVFALAATFYQMLARLPVYNTGPGRNLFATIIDKDIVSLARRRIKKLPPELVAVIDDGLAPEAGARYPDAAAMLDALNSAWKG